MIAVVKELKGGNLPGLTLATNTGLSPLTVKPYPFSSFWMIAIRWIRGEAETNI